MTTLAPALSDIADLVLRGGIFGLCALIGYQMAAIRPMQPLNTLGVLFLAFTALYVLKGTAVITHMLSPAAILALEFPSFMIVVLFWMFVRSLVLDGYRPGWLDWSMLTVNGLTFIPICVVVSAASTPIKIVHLIVCLGLIADALRVTLITRGDDLVESRRKVARAMVYIIPVTGLVISAFVIAETLEATQRIAPVLQSGVIFATILAFAAAVSTLRDNLMAPALDQPKPVDEKALPPADRLELARLNTLMAHGVYLEPGLSIGGLAAKMNMPEHRLRKLINNHLGHRNFAAFINDQRIAEAKRRLGDSTLAREQITGLAFDLGFESLAPFNRAFRERVGMSPSEFRTKALLQAVADTHHPLHS
jgi:AraC-like DNA-binding protein